MKLFLTKYSLLLPALSLFVLTPGWSQEAASPERLAKWLKRFPEADQNKDGKLTLEEAGAYLKKMRGQDLPGSKQGRGAPRQFKVDPGWEADRFPEHAVSYKTPEEIKAIYAGTLKNGKNPVVSYEKQENGVLRIVGTGHSFMAPGYRTFPKICEAAGFQQPLYTHTGGGMTGSTRYKWEQENGIFEFDGKPVPKLLSSIANADWDAMMWGPYFNDRPEYYSCWIEFSRKYHPEMRFYLSDAWPQLYQLGETPKTEDVLTAEVFDKMGDEKRVAYSELINHLREDHGEQIYIMPTSDAMLLAAKHYLKGELPGIEGINTIIGKKKRSLWRDHLGHLGPGFDRLEGYVFYSTIYGKSAELLDQNIKFGGDGSFPSKELDKIFRKIAWKAVTGHPLSGVRDADEDGIGD